jgi:hypothetical protein
MATTQGGLCNDPAGIIQVHPADILGSEPSDEDVTMPLGESVAGVNHPSRGCDGRSSISFPLNQRLRQKYFPAVRGDVPIDDLARALPWWMRPRAKMIFKKQVFPCRFQKLYHLPAAEIIKPVVGNMLLILVGGVRTLGEMETVLSESKADLLSMSRPFIREPFLAKRMRQGKTKEAACISCNKCFAAVFNELPLRCYVDGLP